ncbi:hypothetical protein [Ekhidna sp.]|uniref:hypothetical protein n=1 Tax=Ekhidna sp. TaxID=2608089 RepID=UPI003CCC2540
MELLELQATWQLFNDNVIKKDFVEPSTIGETIHQKSKSEIAGIKRSMHFKFIIGTVTMLIGLGMIAAMYFAPDFNLLSNFLSHSESFGFYIIITLALGAMIAVNHRAYKHIKQLNESTSNLKQGLSHFTRSMRKAMNFNIYSDALMSPVFITWIYYTYAFKNQTIGWDVRSLVLFVLPVAIGLFSYYFQRYAQHLKFGRYVSRLEDYLESLEENSEKV